MDDIPVNHRFTFGTPVIDDTTPPPRSPVVLEFASPVVAKHQTYDQKALGALLKPTTLSMSDTSTSWSSEVVNTIATLPFSPVKTVERPDKRQRRETISETSLSLSASEYASRLPSKIILTGTGLPRLTVITQYLPSSRDSPGCRSSMATTLESPCHDNRAGLLQLATASDKSPVLPLAVTPHDPSLQKSPRSGNMNTPRANVPDTGSLWIDTATPRFPDRVYAMVSETAVENPDVIEWVQNGSAFRIHSKHRKLPEILRRFFNHSQYKSLQRQLNKYGWKKDPNPSRELCGAFRHPDFHRQVDPAQLALIRCQRRSRRRSNKQARGVITCQGDVRTKSDDSKTPPDSQTKTKNTRGSKHAKGSTTASTESVDREDNGQSTKGPLPVSPKEKKSSGSMPTPSSISLSLESSFQSPVTVDQDQDWGDSYMSLLAGDASPFHIEPSQSLYSGINCSPLTGLRSSLSGRVGIDRTSPGGLIREVPPPQPPSSFLHAESNGSGLIPLPFNSFADSNEIFIGMGDCLSRVLDVTLDDPL